jgi:hypothetical protein
VRSAGAVAIVVTLVSLGGLLERKSWARALEAIRVVVLLGAAAAFVLS